jgi:hypothetical protein
VVEKGWPTEAVGVVVRIDNKIQVLTSDVSLIFSKSDASAEYIDVVTG